MSNIDLFYEIKNLFNTSERAFKIFDELRYTTMMPNNDAILCITVNLKAKEELIDRYKMFTDFRKVNENILESEKYPKKTIEIITIENLIRRRTLNGKRYAEIRFYQ